MDFVNMYFIPPSGSKLKIRHLRDFRDCGMTDLSQFNFRIEVMVVGKYEKRNPTRLCLEY